MRTRQSNQARGCALYTATEFVARPLFRSAFRLNVVAPERIPAQGPLVIVANHESNLDGFVLLSVFTNRRLTFLSAAHLFERPIIGWYLRGIGALPVSLQGQRANVSSLRDALTILAGGGTIAVFPQGGIARDETHGGAVYLALKAQAMLLPVHISGARKVLPPDGGRPSFARLTVRIGVPISAQELAAENASTSAAVAAGTRLIGERLSLT
jgi:1-acyl-sn-glycerol-3-phosphate acyltransferase